jgi:PAS domain S-box-containing protein
MVVSTPDILAAKILIVDDRESNVLLLRRMLVQAGYLHVASTMDPREVCGLHRKHDFDLILLDLQMPGMDGFEVLEGLKAIEKDSYCSVLAITAAPNLKLRALWTGAMDFVGKPFDVVELKTRIHNILEVRLLYKKLENVNHDLEMMVQSRTAELRASEARFRSLTELASDWYWQQDARGTITEVSGAAPEMRGMGLEGAANDSERVALAENVALRRPFVDFSYRRANPDGSNSFLQVSGEPIFDSSGHFTGYRGVGTDVTERTRAELAAQRFRLAADNMRDAILFFSRSDMKIIDVNDTACRMFGYTRNQLLMLDPGDLGAGSRAELEQHYDRIIGGEPAGDAPQFHLRRMNASTFSAEVHWHAQASHDGGTLVMTICEMSQRN